MNFEEFKNKAAGLKAPGSRTVGTGRQFDSESDLISILKRNDELDKKKLHKMIFSFSVLTVIYLLIFTASLIWPPDTQPGANRTVLLLAVLLFFLSAGLARFMVNRISKTDYSKPVSDFIEQVMSRYSFFDMKATVYYLPVFIIALFTVYLSIETAAIRYIGEEYLNLTRILSGALIFVSVTSGILIWRKEWRKKKEPLWLELKKLKDDLTVIEEI